MTRLYSYVGPEEIRARASRQPAGEIIHTRADLDAWVSRIGWKGGKDGWLPVTFVVDEAGSLRLADRHSEHIACAGGGPVRAAGEMFFDRIDSELCIIEVSNQSTGFCPEPESWAEVAPVLDALPITHPGRFTRVAVFRRCPACGERNLIKDDWFVCALCGADLPTSWNFV